MLKIIYATGNYPGSELALSRFLDQIKDKKYIIKIAAYKDFLPNNISVDWVLDSIYNIYNSEKLSFDKNDNLNLYYEHIKKFKPHLIISDLEPITSHIANILNIPIWQCSSRLICYGFDMYKFSNFQLRSKYYFIWSNKNKIEQYMKNSILNADNNFIYSHWGDTNIASKIILKDNFNWIRPYSYLGEISIPCQHQAIGTALSNNRNIIKELQNYEDSVLYTKYPNEKYNNVILKNINNQEEYFCNLKNSNILICEGQSNFMADAFYNQIPIQLCVNYQDPESVINNVIQNSEEYDNKMMFDENILFLHQQIEKIFN